MNCEISTAPVLPPPGPGWGPAGFGVLGPGCSLQQAELSLSASSKATVSWSPIVLTAAGYTEPWPTATPSEPTVPGVMFTNAGESAWVNVFGGCPLTNAT